MIGARSDRHVDGVYHFRRLAEFLHLNLFLLRVTPPFVPGLLRYKHVFACTWLTLSYLLPFPSDLSDGNDLLCRIVLRFHLIYRMEMVFLVSSHPLGGRCGSGVSPLQRRCFLAGGILRSCSPLSVFVNGCSIRLFNNGAFPLEVSSFTLTAFGPRERMFD